LSFDTERRMGCLGCGFFSAEEEEEREKRKSA